ncbi:MAG: hypothetical protein KJ583_07630 [Nanoarchaeota archaeon]|nr:hypothetical protein [Nanoarchaeota archaeon]MBU1269849.1 hypothetical protein [Nanoarchaeota archaeon]MBU1605158.1 hypothetical protein [Nanoarchaeota archaeon]MBU2442972.1 hypothetical protein [Nanoarchaeota archaeon]
MTKTFLAKGKRGQVYTYKSTIDGREVCVKELNPDSDAENVIKNEARFLRLANEHGIGPTLLKEEDDKVFMDFVHGERILDFFERANKTGIVKVIKDSLDQARKLDQIGVNKYELTNPYKHIIVSYEKPIMIDFERCKEVKKPKNVTQFVQFLTSGKVKRILKTKKIDLDTDELRVLAKKYKEKYNKKLFQEIKEEISKT